MRRNQNFLSSANPRIISESNHPTRKRRSPFNVRNSSFSQNFIIKFRRKAESRADDADIFLVENLSLRRLKFSFGINILASSYQSGHFFELFRLNGKARVRSAFRPRQDKMLLYDGCAGNNRRDRGFNSGIVVGKARNHPETLGDIFDIREMHVFRTRIVGISRDAMQNRNFFGSVFSQGSDRLFNFLQRRESNRHYDRLSGFCNFFQKRKVSCFIRSNFIAWHFHFFKKVHGGFVKRRREKNKSELFGKLFKLRLPVPGRISAFVKLIKIGAFPIRGRIFSSEKKPFFVGINGYGVGSIGLELYRIRARFSRRLNESNRLIILLAVIRRNFRHKETRLSLTHQSASYFKRFNHRPWILCGPVSARQVPKAAYPILWLPANIQKRRGLSSNEKSRRALVLFLGRGLILSPAIHF